MESLIRFIVWLVSTILWIALALVIIRGCEFVWEKVSKLIRRYKIKIVRTA